MTTDWIEWQGGGCPVDVSTEALRIATQAGQIIEKTPGNELYSEDLW